MMRQARLTIPVRSVHGGGSARTTRAGCFGDGDEARARSSCEASRALSGNAGGEPGPGCFFSDGTNTFRDPFLLGVV